MKRTSRTTLLLSPLIVISIMASARAYRSRGEDSLAIPIRASEAPDSESTKLRQPVIASTTPPASTAKPLHFQAVKLLGQKSIKELEARLGPDVFTLVLKINRLDRKHLRSGTSLLIPDANADLASVSPLPLRLEAGRSIPKLVLVSRQTQAFGAYEFGQLVRWGPTSTGKKSTPTRAGLYHTNWKAKERRSSINQSWILPWCFNIDDTNGVAFHKFDLPGYPASHGCVRLLEEDAKWVYDWAEQWLLSKTDHSILAYGTPVIIFGDYSYGEKAPWQRLADDPTTTAISVTEVDGVLNKYSPTIANRARARELLIAQSVPSIN
jgi:lipoprotein-anchoring transpeptidase ErfK/SrfK